MRKPLWASFTSGALVGTLGGLIGLGGAEFRLPILISFFRFAALEAIILNKAASLIVVATALPFRAGTIPFSEIASHWEAIATLLAGSLFGAWVGASTATQMKTSTLYRTIAVALVFIAVVLLFAHDATTSGPLFAGPILTIIGICVGFAIGVVASLLGVAGGELLIPTFVLLFGFDVKLAGSVSLAVSLPTMLVGFARYSKDDSFAVLSRNKTFLAVMGIGSIAGTFIGGRLLGFVPSTILLPLLSAILAVSAYKVWRHH